MVEKVMVLGPFDDDHGESWPSPVDLAHLRSHHFAELVHRFGFDLGYDIVNPVDPVIRVARAARVDRRTAIETLKTIASDPQLTRLFMQIRSAGVSLKEIAKDLGFGVVEITPDDPRTVGILAGSSSIIAAAGISIRQAHVDDPELNPEPRLTLVTEKKIPGNLIPKILEVKGVEKLSVY